MNIKFENGSEISTVDCDDSKTVRSKPKLYSFDHSRNKHHWAEIITKCDMVVVGDKICWKLKEGENLD